MTPWLRLLALLAVVSLSSACALVPWWASVNRQGTGNDTTARIQLSPDALQDEMFIGLAISGGGSRAANFGAAVMFELADLGLLHRVDAISSVSGGSIAAAYYALQGYPGVSFTRREVEERFGRNLQLRWFARWFDPRNALRYWVSAFDRSDIMVQVFEANLFHGATFADLGKHLSPRPAVLINASSAVNGRKFVFSNEEFNRLRSDLSSYPVARAVMASGAFPAAFANVTLRDHRWETERRYVHLFDGGPIDNLGIGTLLKVVQNHLAERYARDAAGPPADEPPDLLRKHGLGKGCLIIAVDAYTDSTVDDKERARLADMRPWYGFLIDPNLADATSDLLSVKRNEVLHQLGLDSANRDAVGSFPLFGLNLDDDQLPNRRAAFLRTIARRAGFDPSKADGYVLESRAQRAGTCHVWHITLSQLPPIERCPLGDLVNGISTAYRIDKEAQCGLFEAARRLVRAMWRDFGLDRLIAQGFPTAAPLPGTPLSIERPMERFGCDWPAVVAENGKPACQITLSSSGPAR